MTAITRRAALAKLPTLAAIPALGTLGAAEPAARRPIRAHARDWGAKYARPYVNGVQVRGVIWVDEGERVMRVIVLGPDGVPPFPRQEQTISAPVRLYFSRHTPREVLDYYGREAGLPVASDEWLTGEEPEDAVPDEVSLAIMHTDGRADAGQTERLVRYLVVIPPDVARVEVYACESTDGRTLPSLTPACLAATIHNEGESVVVEREIASTRGMHRTLVAVPWYRSGDAGRPLIESVEVA